jgi:ABC-2 type transport system ATP-binding protein
VIDAGEIVARGTPEELKRSVKGDAVTLGFAGEENQSTVATIAAHVEGATEPEVEGTEVRFRVPDGAGALPGFLREMVAKDIELTSVEVHRPTLDDVFLTLTGRSLREDNLETGSAEQAA